MSFSNNVQIHRHEEITDSFYESYSLTPQIQKIFRLLINISSLSTADDALDEALHELSNINSYYSKKCNVLIKIDAPCESNFSFINNMDKVSEPRHMDFDVS